MLLRGTQVLARCDERGEPLPGPDGRVEIRYKATDGRAYYAGKRNLEPIRDAKILSDDACVAAAPSGPSASQKKAKAAQVATSRTHSEDTIVVYADGACSGNPGPSGVGVVIQDRDGRRELSLFLGEGTNNIAELTGLLEAANVIEDASRPVRMHTDSSYAIGVLSKGWKAKANLELIARVRAALARFEDLELIHVPGHAGVPLNERADVLAVQAVKNRESTGWIKY
jgi:ribonuclease HI